jgi:hypothetical protein
VDKIDPNSNLLIFGENKYYKTFIGRCVSNYIISDKLKSPRGYNIPKLDLVTVKDINDIYFDKHPEVKSIMEYSGDIIALVLNYYDPEHSKIEEIVNTFIAYHINKDVKLWLYFCGSQTNQITKYKNLACKDEFSLIDCNISKAVGSKSSIPNNRKGMDF